MTGRELSNFSPCLDSFRGISTCTHNTIIIANYLQEYLFVKLDAILNVCLAAVTTVLFLY